MFGYLEPLQGRVILGEENITDIYCHERLDHGIAFLPQGRSVFPRLSVHENLEVGAWTLRRNRDEFQGSLEATYERYPVLKDLRRRIAGNLSGGQQRILEIARMMVPDPSILLIDEPTAGLAPILAGEVYDEIRRLNDEGRTILLVDQNVQAAVAMADYVYSLEYGRNHMQGERLEFEKKLTELVKGWLRLSEINSD
jgi:branched-chain amino acid transport system ATP-binding protein